MTQWIGGLGIVFFTIAVLPYLGLSDKAIWELQDKALVKLRVALNRYILQQEINRQQHFDQ